MEARPALTSNVRDLRALSTGDLLSLIQQDIRELDQITRVRHGRATERKPTRAKQAPPKPSAPPKPIEAVQVDPRPVEAVRVDPQPIEAVRVDPQPIEAVRADPQPIEAVQADPQPIEALQVDPQPVEALQADPQPVEALQADPQPVEALQADPSPAERKPGRRAQPESDEPEPIPLFTVTCCKRSLGDFPASAQVLCPRCRKWLRVRNFVGEH